MRILSLALAGMICLNLISFQVFAMDRGNEPTAEPDTVCEHHENTQTASYYLLLIHTLTYHGI